LEISNEKLWQNDLSWFVRLAYRNSDNKVVAVGHIAKPKHWFPFHNEGTEYIDPVPPGGLTSSHPAINCTIDKVSIGIMDVTSKSRPATMRVHLILNPHHPVTSNLHYWADFPSDKLGAGIETLLNRIAGVQETRKLEGRFVRVRHIIGRGKELGHLLEDVWMDEGGAIAQA
jgi:hypothetical protein